MVQVVQVQMTGELSQVAAPITPPPPPTASTTSLPCSVGPLSTHDLSLAQHVILLPSPFSEKARLTQGGWSGVRVGDDSIIIIIIIIIIIRVIIIRVRSESEQRAGRS